MAIEELNSILWEERGLLDTLQFTLEVEQWVLSSGRMQWLNRSTDQVQEVVAELRRTEILRAAAADAVADAVGLPSAPSLSALATRVPEPWSSILADQRAALVAATAAVDRVSYAVIDDLSGLRTAITYDEGT